MRVVHDRAKCILTGMCEALVPDVFEIGDDELTLLAGPVPPDREAEVRRAVDQCPAEALRVAGSGGL